MPGLEPRTLLTAAADRLTVKLTREMWGTEAQHDEVVARLRTHGAELVGEVTRYEDAYLLCYIRGPEGIIVALAQPLS